MADAIDKLSKKFKAYKSRPPWHKRPKSALSSASQPNTTRASTSSASGAHNHGSGNNTKSAESTPSGGNATVDQDPALFQLAGSTLLSVPDVLGSAVDQGHGDETSDTSTRMVQSTPTHPETQVADWKVNAKEGLGVASRFAQTLLKKVPDCVDSNPVKMAFSIAKVIIEIKDEVGDNMDELARGLKETANILLAVKKGVDNGVPKAAEEAMGTFTQILGEEMKKLRDLSAKWVTTQILDHEDYKKKIRQVFQRVEGATRSFQATMMISIQNTTTSIQNATTRIQNVTTDVQNTTNNIQNTTTSIQNTANSIQITTASIEQIAALERLRPSYKADHKTVLEEKTLKREECTSGTRVKILEDITKWANDSSSARTSVFWLTGQAGSGKTTIAYTIAKLFEKAGQRTILGGNFLCSRQFEETRQRTRIIPTLAYQLAHKCKSYADALHSGKKFDAVNHDVLTQLEDLLVGPWQQSETSRGQEVPSYLIVIDAIDEIEDDGGSAFLRHLLTAIASNQHVLRGLKFLVTSRPDPEIVALCKSFPSEDVLRLQDVPLAEAELDIGMYLDAKLPKLAGSPELAELVRRTGGLFIYAATAVKHLTRSRSISSREQAKMLDELLSNSYKSAPASKVTSLIDELYRQIMHDTFSKYEGEILTGRLHILYTFLCTAERTPASTVAALVVDGDDDAARAVVEDLHAVLYTQDDHVFWYHASFPDFIFDGTRSNFRLGEDQFEFSCNGPAHHKLLGESCFRVMSGLRFNMGDIESSFLFDSDHAETLSAKVDNNISIVLRYSCRHWTHHLPSPQFINTEDLLRHISDFLDIHVLFWIEVMNLLRSSNKCTTMLQYARQWVLKHGGRYLKLAVDVGEAANFATYFIGSPAAKSTPHLYISALATWLHDTGLCRNWKKQFACIPTFTHTKGRIDLPLMTVLAGSPTLAVAFSSDGTRIVSGSRDRSVRVWDASTGAELNVLSGHTSSVKSVAFSSDCTRIVSSSDDGSVRVWDASTGVELNVLSGHTSSVKSVAFSSDGTRIVSGSEDCSVRVWDASTGVGLDILNGHTSSVNSVAFSSNGMRIVSGSHDDSVRVWDASTGAELHVLNGHTDWVKSVAFSSDGTQIVSGSDDRSVRVWDASTGAEQNVLNGHTNWVNSVAFSSDGTRIVSGSYDRSVRVWDAFTGVELNVLNGPTSSVNSVAFSSDGTQIVSGSDDFSVRVWDASTGAELNVLNGHTSSVSSVAFSSDGTRIVSGSYGHSVRVWDALTGAELNVLKGHTNWVNSVAFSSDGTRIVSGSDDVSVRLWDALTGTELNVLHGHTYSVNSVAFSNDSTRIVSGSGDHSVRVWDALTGVELNVLNGHTSSVNSVAFSSNGMRIVSGSHDHSVRVWDTSAGAELNVLNGHTEWVKSVAFSSDGTRIVSGSNDCSVRVWDALTGVELNVLNGHTYSVNSVMFSSDGTRIVSGSHDRSVRVWDASMGSGLKVLNGHTSSIKSVVFSSDGTRIVSGSDDRSVRVWDVSTGSGLNVLNGHTHSVKSVTFSSDGTRIVSNSDDQFVQVQDALAGAQLNMLKSYTGSVNPVTLSGDHHFIWNLTDTSWIISSLGQNHLMWVPKEAHIAEPSNILVISRHGFGSVDFRSSKIGVDWVGCYTP